MLALISGELYTFNGRQTWGGATWYRAAQILKRYGDRGKDWIAGKDGTVRRDGIWLWDPVAETLARPDTILFVRCSDSAAFDAACLAKDAGQRVVLDLDDHIWEIPRSNAAHRLSTGEDPEISAQYWVDMSRVADVLVASTPYLAQEWERRCEREVVVRENLIDVARWTRPYQHGRRLGWTGSTAHRDGELPVISAVLQQSLFRGWLPRHVGSGDIAGIQRYGPYPVDEWWRSADHYDVGIAAVADSSFSRCKSDIKILEYSAAQKPWVAYGYPYRSWADVGIVLDRLRPQDYLAALDELADPAYAREIAEACYARAEERDLAKRWTEYVEVWLGE